MGRETEIEIIAREDVYGDGSDVIETYRVVEEGKEFHVTRRSNRYGCAFGLKDRKGLLYVDSEDHRVRLQEVALGGGCGLIITEELIEGLTPSTLRTIAGAGPEGAACETKTTPL